MTIRKCSRCAIGFQRSDDRPECSECEDGRALVGAVVDMREQPRASIADMQAWAHGIMRRAPDFIIGDDYLRRWWVIPRNDFCNIYLHEILHSDDDRALHDHPWANSSWVIEGGYIEHVPFDRPIVRNAGDFVAREATALHRLELPEGGRAVSLFITGPKIREWGFACPQGWRHWKDFVAENPGQVGRGCGE